MLLGLQEIGPGRLPDRQDREEGRHGGEYHVEGGREGVAGCGDQPGRQERRAPPEDGDREVVAYGVAAVAHARGKELGHHRDGSAYEDGFYDRERQVRQDGAQQAARVHEQEEGVGQQREADARRQQQGLASDAVGERAQRYDERQPGEPGQHYGNEGDRTPETKLR